MIFPKIRKLIWNLNKISKQYKILAAIENEETSTQKDIENEEDNLLNQTLDSYYTQTTPKTQNHTPTSLNEPENASDLATELPLVSTQASTSNTNQNNKRKYVKRLKSKINK